MANFKTYISSLQDSTYRYSAGGDLQQLQVETLQRGMRRNTTTRLGAEARLHHTGDKGEAVNHVPTTRKLKVHRNTLYLK